MFDNIKKNQDNDPAAKSYLEVILVTPAYMHYGFIPLLISYISVKFL